MTGVIAIDWESLKNGTTMHMKDFPSVIVIKLSNSKACFFKYDYNCTVVDIKEHTSEEYGSYFYFQTTKDDWHPLTNRLWEI